jgi:hypothetical protein
MSNERTKLAKPSLMPSLIEDKRLNNFAAKSTSCSKITDLARGHPHHYTQLKELPFCLEKEKEVKYPEAWNENNSQTRVLWTTSKDFKAVSTRVQNNFSHHVSHNG